METSSQKRIAIDIISGFLGAGKTTLIRKLVADGYPNEKIVLIENEFGDVNIDAQFLNDTGIEMTQLSAGCICCSLTKSFSQALGTIVQTLQPDRILIEPTGVAKIKDVRKAILAANLDCLYVRGIATVVCGETCVDYIEGYGDFYEDQISSATCVLVNQMDELSPAEQAEVLENVRRCNPTAPIITTPWEQLASTDIVATMQGEPAVKRLAYSALIQHHQQAANPFVSVALETAATFSAQELQQALQGLASGDYGKVLRAKGVVTAPDGWHHFDFTPAVQDIRTGEGAMVGMVCIIGEQLDKQALRTLFHAV